MTNLTTEEIYNYTENRLKAHYQNDSSINEELSNLLSYYNLTLVERVKDEDKERLKDELFQTITQQIFNGYFIVVEILNLAKEEIPDDNLKQPVGILTQQIPDLLRSVTGENYESTITHEPFRKLSSWLITEYEGIYPLLMDLALNTAVVGSKWAFLDERDKRGLVEETQMEMTLFADPMNVTYLNPETYITADIINENAELWTITKTRWNGFDKLGEITIIKTVLNEVRLNISIKANIAEAERNIIIDRVIQKVTDSNLIQDTKLTITITSVNEYFELIDKVKDDFE
ncbi:hypothetical protein [Niallia sp. FSL R7-0271]|uniref:hypothetical protein n=1 Tax=Niallia sp. FSL R7-0271 TaxID=2921678 RepID=UPI0030F672FC